MPTSCTARNYFLIQESQLDVYAVADLIQHGAMKRIVERKFEELLKVGWTMSTFPAMMRKVFEIAPPGAQVTPSVTSQLALS